MKKTKNKILIRMISLMLVAITLIPANIGAIIASAMVVNGTGSSGNSSTSTATGNYSIQGKPVNFAPDSNADIPVAGMRFSVYNTYEKSPKFTHSSRSIDVFGAAGYDFISSRDKFDRKLNKMQLRKRYGTESFSTSLHPDNERTTCYRDIDINPEFPLPTTIAEYGTSKSMVEWESYESNYANILNLIDSGKYPIHLGVGSLEYGDRILVEPLFPIQVGGVYYCLTVTEIAIMGVALYGRNSNGNPSSKADTWGFIANYTNRIFANTMYLSEPFNVQTSTGGSNDWLIYTASPINGCAQFWSIIEGGYGMHIAYTSGVTKAPNKCKVNVKFWLNGMPEKNADGSIKTDDKGNVVMEGKTFPLFHSYEVEKGSEFSLTRAYEVFKYKPATASTGSSFRLDGGVPDATERNMYFIQAETKDADWNHHFGDPNYPNYTDLFKSIVVNNDTNLVFV